VKRILLFGLLAGMLTASTGCGLYQAVFCYHPCGGQGGCGPGYCGDECDDGCGPACGPTRRPVRAPVYASPRRAVIADCDENVDCDVARPCRRATCATCDPCSDPCGSGSYGRCWHRGPLSCLFALLAPNTWCGPSCGERYWGDFYSDAPDCSDPCDNYGNYTGSGCHNCGGSHGRVHGHHDGYVDDGTPVAEEMELAPQAERATAPAPKPTPAPRKAAKPQSP